MEKKGLYTVNELREVNTGEQVRGKYLIMDKILRKTKDGKNICNLRIGDASGEIDAIVWDSCNVGGQLEVGAVIGLLGDMGNFAGKPQITARRINVIDEDPLLYLKSPEINKEDLEKRFKEFLQSIKDVYISLLLEKIFTEDFQSEFFQAVAAKKIHHNYSGGLLEHTVQVAELCQRVGDIYPVLNRDLLICGALLHDIAKVSEYEIKITPRYTAEGKMIGHIVMGAELIGKTIKDLRDEGIEFPVELEWMIKHMILSHHGNLEYGSPVIPLFPEALVLHMADNLDAKLFVFLSHIKEDEGEDEYFTTYDNFFQQNYFKYRYGDKDE